MVFKPSGIKAVFVSTFLYDLVEGPMLSSPVNGFLEKVLGLTISTFDPPVPSTISLIRSKVKIALLQQFIVMPLTVTSDVPSSNWYA